jgi:adenylylsulfate kinase
MTDEGMELNTSTRAYKEARLGQRALVVWLYGISGAGKTTLAHALETRLAADGFLTRILDGDELRKGLNSNLGFDDAARTENIRRSAETARLFLDTGIITIAAFICPKREMREQARQIIGEDDFVEIFVKASYEGCARRDVKGLYAKAAKGDVKQFTGKDSAFEEPEAISSAIILETERHGIAHCTERILDVVMPRIRSHKSS